MKVKIYRLTGRCADGAERDGGTKWHAVPLVSKTWPFLPDDNGVPDWKALCGAKPGRRSAGWSQYTGTEITCPRCKLKLEFLKSKEGI